MFQEDVMRWKCFVPHPLWEGSRGYVLRYKGEIAAFGCVVPCRFGMVTSCNVIDWAASKAVPGAGLMLYRHIQSLAGSMINIGGTPDARAVLPKVGFQVRTEIHHYTRVVRPWKNFLANGQKDWKSPLRVARDYRELARSQSGETLTAQRVQAFGDGLLDHFLTCPAVRMEGFQLEREGQAVGHFLLSRAGGECRIAGLWTSEDCLAAYSAAMQAAADATQIRAASSSPVKTAALERAGFRRTHSEPVFVLDPDRRLPDEVEVSLLENDGFYWHK